MRSFPKICNKPLTYVLIHGAWHGSWCWNKLSSRLQSFGHKVLTPDLPGHYKNKADFKNITLKSYVDHVQDIVLRTPDPVILVGHSMAGVVISQVAENISDKISRLVYVSGFIPVDGGSLLDEEKKAVIPTVANAITVDEASASISLPLHELKIITDLFYANCDEETRRYALSHLQKQPLLPFVGTVSVSSARFGSVPKLYIECLQDKAIMIQDQRRMQSYVPCEVATIDTDHSPFFSATDELANILMETRLKKSVSKDSFSEEDLR